MTVDTYTAIMNRVTQIAVSAKPEYIDEVRGLMHEISEILIKEVQE